VRTRSSSEGLLDSLVSKPVCWISTIGTPQQELYGAATSVTKQNAANRYMCKVISSPGRFRAWSERRQSDNCDNSERRVPRKYLCAFLRARFQRVLAFQRWARRDAERKEESQAREITRLWIDSELERRARTAEVGLRSKLASAWSQRWELGLTGLFTRAKKDEDDPLYRFTGMRTNRFKRGLGRLAYVILTDLPVVAAIPKISSTISSVSRGMCPCGQHVLAYVICNEFWKRVGVHNLEYLEELALYSWVNSDYSEEIWMKWVDCAREYNFKADRGRKLIAETARKTFSRMVPGGAWLQASLGLASDAYYVVTGHSPSINSYRKALDQYLITRSTVHPVDEVAEFLTMLAVNHHEEDAFTWARNIYRRRELVVVFAIFCGCLDDDVWMYISYASQTRGMLTLNYSLKPFLWFLEEKQDLNCRKLFKTREFYEGYFSAHGLAVRCSHCGYHADYHRAKRCRCKRFGRA